MIRGALLACIAILVAPDAAAQAAALRERLARGDAAGAYRLGMRQPQRLGEPEFDLAFGTAAVHAGHPAEGVLALERFLLSDPAHDAARLDLARGYFLVGEDARAGEEFERALALGPPPAVRRVIEEHLDALRARRSRHGVVLGGHVEAAAGHDSNPRAGIDDPVISLPVLGEVTVDEVGVRRRSAAWQYGAGARAAAPLGAFTAFAAAQADFVRYAEAGDFDQDLFAGSAGVASRYGAAAWRAGASTGYQTLGRNPYRRSHGVFAETSRPVGAHLLSVAAQWGRLLYEGASVVRDADFAAATLGGKMALGGAWRWTGELALNAGRERNRSGERQDLSRDIVGGRIGFTFAPLAPLTLGAGATWLRVRHREPDAVLQTRREDDHAALDAQATWRLARDWWIRLEYVEARNESNLALYEYRRRTGFVRVRHEFR